MVVKVQEMSTVVTDGEDVGVVRFPSHVPLDEAGREALARCLSCDENQSRAVNMAPTRAHRCKKVPVHTRAAARIYLRLPLGTVLRVGGSADLLRLGWNDVAQTDLLLRTTQPSARGTRFDPNLRVVIAWRLSILHVTAAKSRSLSSQFHMLYMPWIHKKACSLISYYTVTQCLDAHNSITHHLPIRNGRF